VAFRVRGARTIGHARSFVNAIDPKRSTGSGPGSRPVSDWIVSPGWRYDVDLAIRAR